MSSLTLVRHAQASFFADDYDQLSAVGQQQARLLGEFWVRGGLHIDEVYMGPRQRHQQTAMAVAAVFEQAGGLPLPKPVVLQELDEYDLRGVMDCLAPLLAREDREFAALMERQRHGATPEEQARNFQRMFEPLMIHWQRAGESCAGVESWPAFQARVERGLKTMTDTPGRGRSIVAFSSGGFIGTATALVLGAPPRTALELNWRIHNAALTEFVFTRQRIALDAFNCIAHLPQAVLVTYR
jgi:broad specificity phosphatase PhoE